MHSPVVIARRVYFGAAPDGSLEMIAPEEDHSWERYADQRSLEIGITISGNPETILLDEPTAGMSKSETDRAVKLIHSIAKKRTLLIVEHDMSVVFDISDTISVLVYGKVICSDKPENVRNNRDVKEAYLGNYGE